jgi:hypothetical protein
VFVDFYSFLKKCQDAIRIQRRNFPEANIVAVVKHPNFQPRDRHQLAWHLQDVALLGHTGVMDAMLTKFVPDKTVSRAHRTFFYLNFPSPQTLCAYNHQILVSLGVQSRWAQVLCIKRYKLCGADLPEDLQLLWRVLQA